MRLAWGGKVSAEFRRQVIAIAELGGFDPSDLMACIAFETGRTFSPAIRNAAGSGATGLIQFMPSTARMLGTTTDALAAMTAEQQLRFVEMYFRPYAGRLKSLADTYMAILRPSAIGKPDDFALITSDEGRTYIQNKGLDLNGDGNITKLEATHHVAQALADGLLPSNVHDDQEQPAAPIEDRSTEYTPPAGGIPEEKNMGSFELISLLTSVFSPLIRAKVEKAVGSDVGGPLVDNLLGMATKLTGKADPLEAVAVARQNPEVVAKMEAASEDWFKQSTPFLEKIASYDREQRTASDESFDKAAKRLDTPDGWGLRLQQVSFTQKFLGYSAISIAALIAAMTGSLALIPDGAQSAVLGLIGQLVIALVTTIGLLGATFRDQNGFSFGGTASGNAAEMAKDELIARRPQVQR